MGKNKSSLWGLLVPNMTMGASFSNRCLYYQSDDKLGVVSLRNKAPFHTCPTVVDMSRTNFYPPPPKKFPKFYPSPFGPLSTTIFSTPFLIFEQLFLFSPPPFSKSQKIFSKTCLGQVVENEISPPVMSKKLSPPLKFLENFSITLIFPSPFGNLLGHVW